MTKQEALAIAKSSNPLMRGASADPQYVGIIIECIEKQIPRKPITKKWVAVDDGVMRTFNCPCCGVDYNRFYIGKPYCQYCSQAIDWSEEDD